MFTDCPSCERLFRIRAAQLKAADGWVRCGYCAETFYALERLYDAPVKTPPPDLPPEAVVEKLPEAGAEAEQAGEQAAQIQVPDQEPADKEEQVEDIPAARQQDQPHAEDIGEEQADVRDQQLPAPDEITVIQQVSNDEVAAETATESEFPDDLPPVLESEADKPSRSYSRLIWSGLLVVLLLVALAQLAWFNRDWLLREYPQLIPWAERVCEPLQCDLIRFRDVSAIRLVDRDVRSHPRYRNAVLVSATIINHAGFVQPYPEIELAIYDTGGRVISHGRFTSAEYLEPGIDPAAGMPPGVPVHFVLELAGAAQEAVGFEFRFH